MIAPSMDYMMTISEENIIRIVNYWSEIQKKRKDKTKNKNKQKDEKKLSFCAGKR